MTIKEYVASIKAKLLFEPVQDYDWRHAFNSKGYPSALLSEEGHKKWPEVHRWCREHIGEDHYAWTGSRFWFDNDEAAFKFILRWV
jgi:hypothetical protein